MIFARTASPEQTRELAAALADVCRSGDLILLVGDLGAGKTTFTQGFAAALGVTVPVTSPTFTLAHRYDGRIRLHHLDVYRLEHLSEVYDLDLPELLDDGAVTLIEWGDAILAALPAQYLELSMTLVEGDGVADDERHFSLRPVGSAWLGRQHALTSALSPWSGV